MSEPMKVLFLAGKGRSGGTLLAGLMGQLPGFFSVGELNRLWDWGLSSNFRCGCGHPVQECDTWRAVIARADEIAGRRPGDSLATAGIDRAQAAVVRWPNVPRLLRTRPDGRRTWPDLERYTDAASAVYRAIGEVTGAKVVVDSSRLPFEPVALGLVPDVEVRIAHLVRDPRAVVYSWKRTKKHTDRDSGEMDRFGATYSTASWTARNLVVEAIGRRTELRLVHYDDLARDPAGTLTDLAEFVGEQAGDLGFITDGAAEIRPTHSVGGNPIRMHTGSTPIRPDDEWREQIGTRDRLLGTTLALPLLHRYDLPVRTRR